MSGLALGHGLGETAPAPSGWRVRCECGHISRGVTRGHALENHGTHLDAARAERARRQTNSQLENVRCGRCGHWQDEHRDGHGACSGDDEAAMGGCVCECFTTVNPYVEEYRRGR